MTLTVRIVFVPRIRDIPYFELVSSRLTSNYLAGIDASERCCVAIVATYMDLTPSRYTLTYFKQRFRLTENMPSNRKSGIQISCLFVIFLCAENFTY